MAFLVMPNFANAQASEECMVNISLFGTAAKNKNYADALGPWEKAYAECPTAHESIYMHGESIVNWQISQTKEASVRLELFDKLMRLYDQRIEYFAVGKPAKRASILGRKAYFHLQYKPKDKETVYPWLKEALTVRKEKAGNLVFQQFFTTTDALYAADSTLVDQYITDYTLVNEAMASIIANPSAKNHAKVVELKNGFDIMFAKSGAADCHKMNSIFKDEVEKNKANLEYLERTMRFFKGLRCIEEEAYFLAAKYAHEIQPNADAAEGLGNMSYVQGNIEAAIKYYLEAAELYTTNEEKADVMMKIAQCYNKNDQKSKTREYCKKSIELNGNNAAPYFLLGSIYASAGQVSDDPILNKAKFWAAVDQFAKAKRAESTPEVQEQANTLISRYRVYFPSKEEIFMHPEIEEGKSYFVGGIVSESTTVRSK